VAGAHPEVIATQAGTRRMDSGIHRGAAGNAPDGFGYPYPISLMDPGIHRSRDAG
jgi:hypothetical protein